MIGDFLVTTRKTINFTSAVQFLYRKCLYMCMCHMRDTMTVIHLHRSIPTTILIDPICELQSKHSMKKKQSSSFRSLFLGINRVAVVIIKVQFSIKFDKSKHVTHIRGVKLQLEILLNIKRLFVFQQYIVISGCILKHKKEQRT